MALLGILFAVLSRSDAIMLDGLFSLIGFAMGFVTLKVARLVHQPDDPQFQFGYASFEPFVNLAKGLIIVFLAIFALYSAVDALTHGGRPIASGYALFYAVVGAAGCFIIASIQRRTAAKTGSPLVETDAKSWLIDGLLTSGVCVAFLIVMLIERSKWAVYTPYADPVIVIALVACAAPLPFTIIRENLSQLLLGAPEPKFQIKVRARLEAATEGLPSPTDRAAHGSGGKILLPADSSRRRGIRENGWPRRPRCRSRAHRQRDHQGLPGARHRHRLHT